MTSETIWTIVGTVAALLTSFGFVPQVIKMWRSNSVGDVSPVTFYQFTVGVILWALYGLSRKDPVVVAANGFTLLTLIAALVLYHKSRMATAKTLVHHTFRSSLAIGADALVTMRETARGLLLGIAHTGGDVASVARGIIDGAIAGAKGAGMKTRTVASAAATGVVEAAVDVGPEAVRIVSGEFIRRASRTGGDLPTIARETVEKAIHRAKAAGADAQAVAAKAAAGALEAARQVSRPVADAVRDALGDELAGIRLDLERSAA